MTREEEIFQEAKSRFSGEDHEMYQVRAFEAGAHWADSHPHWISGKDKPRENGFYLCYSDKEKAYEILSLYGADWYDVYEHYIPSCDVTHWMPLPTPPTCSEKPNNCEKGDK